MEQCERIDKLEEQVIALQAALSLVLSPEHRSIVHSEDLSKTLKGLMVEDHATILQEVQKMALQHQMEMQRAEVARLHHMNTPTLYGPVTTTGLVGLGEGIIDRLNKALP